MNRFAPSSAPEDKHGFLRLAAILLCVSYVGPSENAIAENSISPPPPSPDPYTLPAPGLENKPSNPGRYNQLQPDRPEQSLGQQSHQSNRPPSIPPPSIPPGSRPPAPAQKQKEQVHRQDNQKDLKLLGDERSKIEFNRLISSARQLIAAGSPAMAIQPLNKAADLQPNNISVYFYRGLAYDESGDPEKACNEYAHSLDLAKSIGMDSAELRINLGNSYLKLNRLKEATYDFERALTIDPRNGPAYLGFGRALLEKGAYDEALKNFRRCDDLGYNNPSLLYLKSLALAGMGQKKEAVEELDLLLLFGKSKANGQQSTLDPRLLKLAEELKGELK